MEIQKIQRVLCLVLVVVLTLALANLIYRDIRHLLTVLYCLTLVMAFLGVIDDDG